MSPPAVQLLEPLKPLEAVQFLPLSYRVYIILLKMIGNKTFRLEVLLEALEPLGFLKLLGPLEALELKTHDVFWAA